jgi:hypothetical protein
MKEMIERGSRPLLDPGFHFFNDPRYSTGPEPYPLGELAGGLKPRDVREAVRDAEDRFEFLLRYELPCHCMSLVKGTLQRPVSLGTAEHTPKSATPQRAHI